MKKYSSILIGVVMLMLGLGVGRLSAGPPDPPGGPTSAAGQMYTLEEIYQRIIDGGMNQGRMMTFTEPDTAPGTGTMHTLNDIFMQIGRSAHVPQTGQFTSYGTGDDGAMMKGAKWLGYPRFVELTGGPLGEGTVQDNLTGLIWLKNANCPGLALNWNNALAAVAQLNSGGSMWYTSDCGDHLLYSPHHHTDWRLPNVRELLSLIDYERSSPALPDGGTDFTNVQSGHYWSSTTVANNTVAAWHIDFDIGTVDLNDTKSGNVYYVWPVRGGQ